jgi:hypothetical protein
LGPRLTSGKCRPPKKNRGTNLPPTANAQSSALHSLHFVFFGAHRMDGLDTDASQFGPHHCSVTSNVERLGTSGVEITLAVGMFFSFDTQHLHRPSE